MIEQLNSLPNGYFILDVDGNIIKVNETFCNWLGYSVKDMKGRHMESILTVANKLMFHSYFYPNLQMVGHIEEMFIHFNHAANYTVPMLLNAKVVGDEIICSTMQMKRRFDYEMELRTLKEQMQQAFQEKNEALHKLEQLHHEIEMKQEELIAMNASLRHMTNIDKLTGIYNRKFFQESLYELMNHYQLTGERFSICLLDIDYFKKVNDTYGHGVGDLVLMQLAQILTKTARTTDIVVRYGGEEFVVLLPNTEEEEAFHFAQKLNETVEQAIWEETGHLTVSIGVYTFSLQDTGKSFVENADKALYESKHNGRNRATMYMHQI